MNKKELEALARQTARSPKSEKDLTDFRQMLTKLTVEAALNVELDDYLGYDKHDITASANSRMATPVKPCRQKMVSLSSTRLEIDRVISNPG